MSESRELYLDLQIRNIDDLVDTSKEIDKLQRRLKDLQHETKEYGTDNKKAQEETKLRLKEERTMYRQQQREMTAVKGSLNDLRVELIRQTAALDKNFVIGTKGWKDQAEKVNELRGRVKEAEESTGRFQRNVGNYSGAIQDAFGRMGGSMGGVVRQIQMAKKQFSGLSTGMIIGLGAMAAALAAVVGAFKLMQGYYASSTERQYELNLATSAFRQSWEDIKTFTYDVIENISMLGFIIRGIEGIGTVIAGEESAGRRRQYVKDMEAFRKRDIEMIVRQAEAELEYNRLRVQANDELTYSDQQRMEMAEQAEQILDKITQERIELKREELRLGREAIALSHDESDEDQRRVAQLEADLSRLASEAENRRQRVMRRRIEAHRKVEAEREAEERHQQWMVEQENRIIEHIDEVIYKLGLEAEARLKNIQLIDQEVEAEERKAENMFRFTHQGMTVTEELWQLELRAAQETSKEWEHSYQRRLAALETMHSMGVISEAQYSARVRQLRQEQTDHYIGTLRQAVGANARAQQAVGLIEQAIAVKRAFMAISKGTAEAAASAPPPMNLLPIAMFLAQTAGLVAQIKSIAFDDVKAVATFSKGGYTGRGKRDEPAGIVHRGEVVFSQKDVSMLGGAAIVDAMRPTRLRGYADGGVVGMEPNRQIGGMKNMIEEMVEQIAEIPVVMSERQVTGMQQKVREIKLRGDL